MRKKRFFLLFIFLFVCLGYHAQADMRMLEVNVDNMIINPIISDYIISNLRKAEAENYDLFYITLDTPGGLLESTRDIVREILNSSVPVIVHVKPDGARAASAGVFITMSAHVAVMAPRTNIGAASPVAFGGINTDPSLVENNRNEGDSAEENDGIEQQEDTEEDERETLSERLEEMFDEDEDDDVMFRKITEDTKAWARNIAATQGRNEEWIIEAIVDASSITAEEALGKNVIDYIARNRTDLFNQIEDKVIMIQQDDEIILTTKDAVIHEDKASFNMRYRILYYLSSPQVAYFLLILGFYGLVFEFTNPGIGFPGIAGAICLLLALLAFQNIPINYAGVLLIGIGILLLIAEFYTPTFGFFTLGSVVSLAIGSLILIQSPLEFMRISLHVIIPVIAFHILIAVLLVSLAFRALRSRKHTGEESFSGMLGEAKETIEPGQTGRIFTHGEYWTARNCGDTPLQPGDEVEVIEREKDRLQLNVRKKEEEEQQQQ